MDKRWIRGSTFWTDVLRKGHLGLVQGRWMGHCVCSLFYSPLTYFIVYFSIFALWGSLANWIICIQIVSCENSTPLEGKGVSYTSSVLLTALAIMLEALLGAQ